MQAVADEHDTTVSSLPLVPDRLLVPDEALVRLQRLQGFDNEALSRAMLSFTDGEFAVWRADTGG